MKKSVKIALRTDEMVFALAFILYISSIAIGRTTFIMEVGFNAERWLKMIRYGAYALCCIKILITCVKDSYKPRQILISLIALLIAAVTVYTNDRTVLTVLIVFLAALHVGFKHILKTYEIVIAVLLCVNILFSHLGISTNFLFDATDRHRWGLGYNWTTVAPITYMFLVFGYLYLRQNRTKWWEYFVLLALAIWFFQQTNTRYTFLTTVLYIGVCFFNRFLCRKPWRLVKSIGRANMFVPLLIATASIALYFLYNPDSAWWERLNSLLSNRLKYGYNAIKNYRITLFGQKIEWLGHELKNVLEGRAHSDDFLDSAYIRNLYLYGFAGLSLILFVYTLGIYKSIRHGDWHLLTIYLFILFFCVFEFWIAIIDVNPFPLLAVTDFGPPKKHREYELPDRHRKRVLTT